MACGTIASSAALWTTAGALHLGIWTADLRCGAMTIGALPCAAATFSPVVIVLRWTVIAAALTGRVVGMIVAHRLVATMIAGRRCAGRASHHARTAARLGVMMIEALQCAAATSNLAVREMARVVVGRIVAALIGRVTGRRPATIGAHRSVERASSRVAIAAALIEIGRVTTASVGRAVAARAVETIEARRSVGRASDPVTMVEVREVVREETVEERAMAARRVEGLGIGQGTAAIGAAAAATAAVAGGGREGKREARGSGGLLLPRCYGSAGVCCVVCV